MLTIIAAITARRGAIGRKGDLIYHISADLKHFKELTTGHTVLMGRRTFLSLPKGALPKRRNIVITSDTEWTAPNVETAHSLDEALALTAADSEIFVIGGGQVYAETLAVADRLCITLIDAPEPDDADTFFPPIDPSLWEITDMSPRFTDPAGIPYTFVTFSSKK